MMMRTYRHWAFFQSLTRRIAPLLKILLSDVLLFRRTSEDLLYMHSRRRGRKGLDVAAEERDGRNRGENTAGERDYDDAPKKIFARFFRLQKIARGRGF